MRRWLTDCFMGAKPDEWRLESGVGKGMNYEMGGEKHYLIVRVIIKVKEKE